MYSNLIRKVLFVGELLNFLKSPEVLSHIKSRIKRATTMKNQSWAKSPVKNIHNSHEAFLFCSRDFIFLIREEAVHVHAVHTETNTLKVNMYWRCVVNSVY